MVDMIVTKEIKIYLRQNVYAGIFGITIAQHQYGCINNQQTNDGMECVLMVTEQGKERHNAVAQGNALHNSPDAKMTKAKQIALDGMIEPVDKQSDSKQQDCALNYSTDYLRCGLEFRLYQRQVARDSHDEQEEWEHKVAWGHAIPLRMTQHLKRFSPTVVYQNHSGNGDSSQYIET